MTASDRFAAPWHKISFDRFLSSRLPALLAERLPLAGYSLEAASERACRLTIDLGAGEPLSFPGLPQPDGEGLFWLDDRPHVVVPTSSSEELDKAEIACAGEQLYAYIAARLGQATPEIEWDAAAARALLPLDAWFAAFLRANAQPLDATNWNARTTHLRRLLIPERARVVAPGQIGRVDPFETPEGPGIGRVFTVALGAEIRDGRLLITASGPEDTLGHNAAQVPFLENDDANRLLMGINMMRQALVPPEAEPALVQTGLAPAAPGPDFWCGRNLLTAFVAWGEASVEDGLVISESCARRLGYPYPAEPGDKLANRHGHKGVVSQVLPDAQMPHLADGTPVEIVCSFSGLARRCMVSLVREAVLGRVARAEGRPAIVPPFRAPGPDEIRARLLKNGLPESGMERLRAGQDGPELSYPSTVGWVYWYRLASLARPLLRTAGGQPEPSGVEHEHAPHPIFPAWENGQELGELELRALLQAGAVEIAREALTTRALRGHGDATPYFQSLSERLAAAGILLELDGKRLALRFGSEKAVEPLALPRPARHPWLPDAQLSTVGRPPAGSGPAARAAFDALAQASERLARWLSAAQPPEAGPGPSKPGANPSQTGINPSAYLNSLSEQLDARLAAYLDALLPESALRFSEPQSCSARAVISPSVGLNLDQVGLPAEIVEALFGEQAFPKQSWVIIHRSPALSPTALLAFHPVPVEGSSIRLHPQACVLLNADFDGDQVAVFLPLSPAAQREAGEKLSVEGHLRRDPGLLPALLPPHEGLWGLGWLSFSAEGRRKIAARLGVEESRVASPFARSDLSALLAERLSAGGTAAAIQAALDLARLGYAACAASGASLSPFPASQVPLPPPPAGEDPEDWRQYADICSEAILSARDYANPNLGPQLLSAAVRQKERQVLRYLVGPGGASVNAEGQTVIARHSISEGRTPAELFASVNGARQGLARLIFEGEEILKEKPPAEGALTVLARARRACRSGIVFARAAASGEVDPLTDEETRVLLGV